MVPSLLVSTSAKKEFNFELGTASPALAKAARSSSLSNLPLRSRSMLLKSFRSSLSVSSMKVRNSSGSFVCQTVCCHGASLQWSKNAPSYCILPSRSISTAFRTSCRSSSAFLRAAHRTHQQADSSKLHDRDVRWSSRLRPLFSPS